MYRSSSMWSKRMGHPVARTAPNHSPKTQTASTTSLLIVARVFSSSSTPLPGQSGRARRWAQWAEDLRQLSGTTDSRYLLRAFHSRLMSCNLLLDSVRVSPATLSIEHFPGTELHRLGYPHELVSPGTRTWRAWMEVSH